MVFFWGCWFGRETDKNPNAALLLLRGGGDDCHATNGCKNRRRGGGGAAATNRRRRSVRDTGENCRGSPPGSGPCPCSVADPGASAREQGPAPLPPRTEKAPVGGTPPAPTPTSTASYRLVSRSRCRLLQLCYEQRWGDVLDRLLQEPTRHDTHRTSEAYLRTNDSLRTALHLATLPGTCCPPHVLAALVRANPHAVTIRDRPLGTSRNGTSSTPLHFLCGGRHKNDLGLVQLFVDAAVLHDNCQCETEGGRLHHRHRRPLPSAYLYSPLFVACREYARPETIRILVQSALGVGGTEDRPVAPWIAPLTGGESWVEDEAGARRTWLRLDDADGMAVPSFLPLAELWKRVHPMFREIDAFDSELVARMRNVLRKQLRLSAVAEEGTHESAPVSGAPDDRMDDLTRAWTTLMILIVPHVSSLRTLLHVVVNNLFPTSIPVVDLYQLFCRTFPELLKERDDHGCLPLHCALQRPFLRRSPLTTRPATGAGSSATWPLVSPSFWTHDVLPGLVRCSLKYWPDCAAVVDPTSRLFPALLAASIDAPVSVVFELVLASIPSLFGAKARRR